MFYAVRRGRRIGIFNSWPECQEQVNGFPGAVFKKFKSNEEAVRFLGFRPESRTSDKCAEEPSSTSEHYEQQDVIKLGEIFRKIYKDSRSTGIDQENVSFSNQTDDSGSADEQNEQDEIEQILRDALEAEGMLTSQNQRSQSERLDEVPLYTLRKYGDYYFKEDEQGYVKVFTDGSCEFNGSDNAIGGIGVYFGDEHPLNVSARNTSRPTSINGEIRAAIRAIVEAKRCNIPKLHIYTDSQFLLNSVTKWMDNWKSKDWKLANGRLVANLEDLKQLDELVNSGDIQIKWSYVAGHCGEYGNEQADKLAKNGTKTDPDEFNVKVCD